MHRIELSPAVSEALLRQRERLHMFEELEMSRVAHLVVDLQNGFMEPGAPVEVPVAREIVPNVNLISEAVRAGGGQNVFLQMTLKAESRSSWSNWFQYMVGHDTREGLMAAFDEHAHYWQLHPTVTVSDRDLAVNKSRFGAFVPGASDLHEILQRRGIDTLIVTGTLTNCCCESTARDAMQMNYKVIFVADATAAFTDEAQNATLTNMALMFADVMSTAEVRESIARSTRQRSA